MVELILALGVCVIGICSIMVLFPVGANANRDAALETYSASAAEQLLHYLQYQLTELEWAVDGLPDEKPILEDEDVVSWATIDDFNNILSAKNEDEVNIPGLYMLQSLRGEDEESETEDEESETVDFQAILLVWSSRIIEDVPSDLGVRLNVEVSWPAEIPYVARQKALYCLTVFNPNYNPNYNPEEETP